MLMLDSQPSIIMNSDMLQRHMPYRLGRLFALLERLQLLDCPKITSNIHDRYWASSSVSPGRGFLVPLQVVPVYVGRLPRQQQPAVRRMFEDLSTEVHIAHLPGKLSLTEQGVFSLGYCYQRTSIVGDEFGGTRV